MQKSGGVFVIIASGAFGNAIHFLMIRRRRLDGDAFVEAHSLESSNERGILLDQSLISIHSYFKRGTKSEHGGFETLQENGLGDFVVKEDVSVPSLSSESRKVSRLSNRFNEGSMRVHVKSVDFMVFPVAADGISRIGRRSN